MIRKQEGHIGVGVGLRVGVVGATGVVGGAMLRILEERAFPVSGLRAFATARSAGKQILFAGKPITIEESGDAVMDADVVLFAGGDDASRRYAWGVAERGGVAIDNSSTWRMDPRVPLVVPEVNGDVLRSHQGVVANPNCVAAPLAVALKPLHQAAGVRHCHVATYQSVSGGGIDNMRALLEHTEKLLGDPAAVERGDLDRVAALSGVASPVAFNVRPQWKWDPSGDTEEEMKVVAETRKMLAADIAISVTTMRVPVLVGHTLAVHLHLDRPLDPDEARRALASQPGVEVVDDPANDRVPTPLLASGRDPVYVGRVRPDRFDPRGLRFIVCSDNLRKGAALNAVQIAEHLVALGLVRSRAAAVSPS